MRLMPTRRACGFPPARAEAVPGSGMLRGRRHSAAARKRTHRTPSLSPSRGGVKSCEHQAKRPQRRVFSTCSPIQGQASTGESGTPTYTMRRLSPALSGTLIQAHEDYGLPCEVILMLIAYANKIGRANTSYIESTVRNWADSNILSIAAAEEKLRELDETAIAWKRCENAFGITSRRAPSKNESQFAHRWVFEWRMPDELLNEAYNRCVDNTGKVNMKYINAILESWHNADIHTLKEAVDERIAAEARREGAHKPSYDLDEYEKYDIFATEK